MIPQHMRTYDFMSRILVVFLAVLAPLICIGVYGELDSVSAYWRTDLQPLFIITNAATSFYFYSNKNKMWRFSALMLLLLTAFSVELYGTFHNIIAVLFFISNLYPLYKSNHFKWVLWIYLSSLVIFAFSMLYAEIVAIDALCIFHVLKLIRLQMLQKENDANAHLTIDKTP